MKDLFWKTKKDCTKRLSNSIKPSKDRDRSRLQNNWGRTKKTPMSIQTKKKGGRKGVGETYKNPYRLWEKFW